MAENFFAMIDRVKRNIIKNTKNPQAMLDALDLALVRGREDFNKDPVGMTLDSANLGGLSGLVGIVGSTAGKGAKMADMLPSAPQEEALRIAQKNAMEILGLPANNTAMDRARAMGFDTPVFHETSGQKLDNISAGFNPRIGGAGSSDFETPYAVFVKRNGRSIGLGGENEVQMPLLVREGYQKTFTDRNDLSNWLNNDSYVARPMKVAKNIDSKAGAEADELIAKADELTSQGRHEESDALWDQLSVMLDKSEEAGNRISQIAKKRITDKFTGGGLYKNSGFTPVDSVRIKQDDGSFGRKVDTTMVFNPSNVRSRFAAFDPARRNENNLLASRLLPFGLAGLLGLNQYNEEQ